MVVTGAVGVEESVVVTGSVVEVVGQLLDAGDVAAYGGGWGAPGPPP
jgi:hypothetical protein